MSLRTLNRQIVRLPQAVAIGGKSYSAFVDENTAANGTFYGIQTGVILSATNGSPIAITTGEPHGLASGASVTVSGCGNASANGTWTITVTGSSSFTLNGSSGGANGVGGQYTLSGGGIVLVGSVGNGAYTSGGVVQQQLVTGDMQRATLVPDS